MNFWTLANLFTVDTWDYGILEMDARELVDSFHLGHWQHRGVVRPPRRHKRSYIADTLPWGGDRILAEDYDYASGLGKIVAMDPEGRVENTLFEGPDLHFSFPFSFTCGGRDYLMVEHRDPASITRLYELAQDSAGRAVAVNPRVLELGVDHLVDPVIFEQGDGIYLLGSVGASATRQELCIWHARSLSGPWTRLSDVDAVDAWGRMAGPILNLDGDLYRLGQDHTRCYGNALTLTRILNLSPSGYEEVPVGRLTSPFPEFPHGCHTAAFMDENQLVIDVGRRILPFGVGGGMADWMRITRKRLERLHG